MKILIKCLFDIAEEIKAEHKREKEQIKASFYRSLEQIKEEFANEITLATETLQAKHKKEMGMNLYFLRTFDYKLYHHIFFCSFHPHLHTTYWHRGAIFFLPRNFFY